MSDFQNLFKWRSALYRLACTKIDRHRAEDAVQETFISALKSVAPESWDSWGLLKTILFRRVTDLHRQSCCKCLIDPHDIDNDSRWNTKDRQWEENYGDDVQAALKTLDVKIRETFLFVVQNDFTCSEVAQIFGIPLGTVLTRVSRAKLKLRILLTDTCSKKQLCYNN